MKFHNVLNEIDEKHIKATHYATVNIEFAYNRKSKKSKYLYQVKFEDKRQQTKNSHFNEIKTFDSVKDVLSYMKSILKHISLGVAEVLLLTGSHLKI